jgi:PAS domain S-box-containing protein
MPRLLEQKHYAHEYRFRHANGAFIWMLDQMKIVVRGTSEPTVVGSWTDVSAAHRQREQLESAQAHYRRLIRTSPYSIFTMDATGRVMEVNAAGERILDRTDLLGVNFMELIAPRDLEKAAAFFEQVLSSGSDMLEQELHIRRPDGEERLLVVSVAPIRDGPVTGVHGLARDITDERRIAEERERARQLYERLVTTSPDAIYALDLEGRFTEVSRATAELIGRSVDELIGMPFSSIIAPEDLRKAAESFRRRISGEIETSDLDLHIVRKDGERRLVHIRATQIRDGDRVLGSHGIARDITEERAREERMVLLATALDRLPDGVCITDERSRLVYANSAWFRLLGRDPGVVPEGDVYAETLGGTSLLAALREGLREHGAWRGTLTHASDAGEVVPIEVVALHVTVDEQTLTFCVLRDLTEEVAREQQLRRAERLASVGTLVAGVAHELNNPLTAIAGFAELMLMEPHSEGDREMLQLTMREARRAAKIVADLRLIARETQDTAPSSRSAVDLNDVVQHVLKLQHYTLDTSNIELEVDLADDLPAVHGNASELEQVVLNLIMNARQALDQRNLPHRTISVRTRPLKDGPCCALPITARASHLTISSASSIRSLRRSLPAAAWDSG